MSRPILFRAKVLRPDPMMNPESGWVEGFYYQDLCGGEVRHFIKNCPCDWEIDPATLGQATGLLDRNGTMIFEGDVLEKYNDEGITMHVNYFGAQFGCIQHWDGVGGEGSWYPLDNYFTEEWEVIGNIHDRPDLAE